MMRFLFGLLTFLFFLSRTTGLGSVLSTKYEFKTFGATWENAQHHCREKHTDLATIYSQNDANDISLTAYVAWIDLHRHQSNGRWVWTDGKSREVHWGWEGNNEMKCAALSYRNYNSRGVVGRFCKANLFVACQPNKLTTFPIIYEMMNRSEAENYCWTHKYSGLASFTKDEMRNFSQQDFHIWIRLPKNGGSWNFNSMLSNDTNCVTISSLQKQLGTKNCQTLLPFLCVKENIVLVKENKSWEEAFEHCRRLGSSSNTDLRFNLLSVQPGDDHTNIIKKIIEAETAEVWTALRFLGDEWLWINGADLLYTDLPQCPNRKQHCGALSKHDTGTVEIRDCLERKNFLCYSYKP